MGRWNMYASEKMEGGERESAATEASKSIMSQSKENITVLLGKAWG